MNILAAWPRVTTAFPSEAPTPSISPAREAAAT